MLKMESMNNHKHNHDHKKHEEREVNEAHEGHIPKPDEHEMHTEHVEHATHDHKHMLEDFKRRFFVSTILTIPVLILSPAIQNFLGYKIDLYGSKLHTVRSRLPNLRLRWLSISERTCR